MSEVRSENRAIYAGIPRVSDVSATSGPVQERFSSARRAEAGERQSPATTFPWLHPCYHPRQQPRGARDMA